MAKTKVASGVMMVIDLLIYDKESRQRFKATRDYVSQQPNSHSPASISDV